jgi:hypothetical protein
MMGIDVSIVCFPATQFHLSGVKLTTHFQIEARLTKCGSVHPLPIRLHDLVLN